MGARYRAVKAIADKWTALLIRVPSVLAVAIASNESGFNPSAINQTGGDAARGGSFGLMQMSAATAQEVVPQLHATKNSLIEETLKRYNPADAHTLLDPDLNMLLGIGYLNILAKAFNNDSDLVIAGYNRGRAGVEKLLAQIGHSGISQLDYVRHVNAIRKQLEGYV